ncbi:unnamed protein product, partial [Closterium sp. NIES-53]
SLAGVYPRALHAHWAVLFPHSSAAAPRSSSASLLAPLLADPSPKVRVAAAQALASLLDSPLTLTFLHRTAASAPTPPAASATAGGPRTPGKRAPVRGSGEVESGTGGTEGVDGAAGRAGGDGGVGGGAPSSNSSSGGSRASFISLSAILADSLADMHSAVAVVVQQEQDPWTLSLACKLASLLAQCTPYHRLRSSPRLSHILPSALVTRISTLLSPGPLSSSSWSTSMSYSEDGISTASAATAAAATASLGHVLLRSTLPPPQPLATVTSSTPSTITLTCLVSWVQPCIPTAVRVEALQALAAWVSTFPASATEPLWPDLFALITATLAHPTTPAKPDTASTSATHTAMQDQLPIAHADSSTLQADTTLTDRLHPAALKLLDQLLTTLAATRGAAAVGSAGQAGQQQHEAELGGEGEEEGESMRRQLKVTWSTRNRLLLSCACACTCCQRCCAWPHYQPQQQQQQQQQQQEGGLAPVSPSMVAPACATTVCASATAATAATSATAATACAPALTGSATACHRATEASTAHHPSTSPCATVDSPAVHTASAGIGSEPTSSNQLLPRVPPPGASQWAEVLRLGLLPPLLRHPSPPIRMTALTCFLHMPAPTLQYLSHMHDVIFQPMFALAAGESVPAVQAALMKVFGTILLHLMPALSPRDQRHASLQEPPLPSTSSSCSALSLFSHGRMLLLLQAFSSSSVLVRSTAMWSLANISERLPPMHCSSTHCSSTHCGTSHYSREGSGTTLGTHVGGESSAAWWGASDVEALARAGVKGAGDNDKVKASAVRLLGALACCCCFCHRCCPHTDAANPVRPCCCGRHTTTATRLSCSSTAAETGGGQLKCLQNNGRCCCECQQAVGGEAAEACENDRGSGGRSSSGGCIEGDQQPQMQQCPGDSCISSTANAGLTQIVRLASEAAGAAPAERSAEAGNIHMHRREAENQETASAQEEVEEERESSGGVAGAWQERVVEAILSCALQTNPKVQWSVCAALSLFLQNASVHLPSSRWTAPVLATLQALLQRSSNFKIRIHAAAALIQPCTRADYGPEFSAILHALVSSLASLDVDEQQSAVEQRYKPVLRDQIAATLLHMTSLASPQDLSIIRPMLQQHAECISHAVESARSTALRASAHPIPFTSISDKPLASTALPAAPLIDPPGTLCTHQQHYSCGSASAAGIDKCDAAAAGSDKCGAAAAGSDGCGGPTKRTYCPMSCCRRVLPCLPRAAALPCPALSRCPTACCPAAPHAALLPVLTRSPHAALLTARCPPHRVLPCLPHAALLAARCPARRARPVPCTRAARALSARALCLHARCLCAPCPHARRLRAPCPHARCLREPCSPRATCAMHARSSRPARTHALSAHALPTRALPARTPPTCALPTRALPKRALPCCPRPAALQSARRPALQPAPRAALPSCPALQPVRCPATTATTATATAATTAVASDALMPLLLTATACHGHYHSRSNVWWWTAAAVLVGDSIATAASRVGCLARPLCGGGYGAGDTGQQRQQRQQETLSPQELREWVSQRRVPGSTEATGLGACESSSTCAVSVEALHTFTLDSGATRCFFRDCTTVTLLTTPVSFVTVTTPEGELVAICMDSLTSEHLATFTQSLHSGLYTLTTKSAQVVASGQVAALGQLAASCSCRLLSQQTLLWHHRLGHPSLPRLRGKHSRLLVSGLPRSVPPLPRSLAPPCLPCIEGRQRAAPHSSFPPTTAPLQTLHMDLWGPARLSVQFQQDLPVLRLHCDRGGAFSSGLFRDFCHAEGIAQSFTLPASPQQNGIAERRIRLVMEVAHTSIIHAAAPNFLWPFAVRYAAHQLNLWPRVSVPETSPTLLWTGEVGDASAFQVWGALSLVRDTTASKISPRTLRCVFLDFPTNAPPWQFYHPTSRRVLSSQDVTFDESVCFYCLHPHVSSPLSPPPLFLVPGPPPVDPLPPQGPAPSGVSQVVPPPLVEPLEVSSNSSGPAEGGDPAVDNTAATPCSPS